MQPSFIHALSLIACSVLLPACLATEPATPPPPEGKAWRVDHQGLVTVEVTATSSNSTVAGVTTTQATASEQTTSERFDGTPDRCREALAFPNAKHLQSCAFSDVTVRGKR